MKTVILIDIVCWLNVAKLLIALEINAFVMYMLLYIMPEIFPSSPIFWGYCKYAQS